VANLKTMSLCIRSALSKKVLSKGGKSQQLLLESVRLKLKFNCIAWALPISSTLSTVPTSNSFSTILHPETQTRSYEKQKVVFREVVQPFFILTMTRSPEIHLITKELNTQFLLTATLSF